MNEADASTFVVLGMHRSGTSALARCINILGPRTSDNLMDANSFNASGYWEPKSIVEFNTDVFGHFDRHWADPKPMAQGWTKTATFDALRAQAHSLLDAEFGASGSVVLKDPRLSRVLPIWQGAFASRHAKTVYLIAYRNPLEVAQSLARRDKLTIAHAVQVWLGYMLDAEKNTRGQHRVIINYSHLLKDWRAALRPITQSTTLPDIDKVPKKMAAQLDGFLDPTARHFQGSDVELDVDPVLARLVERAEGLFAGFADDQKEQAFDEVGAQWTEFLQTQSPGDARSPCVDQIPQVQMENSRTLERAGRLENAIALVRTAAVAADDRAHYHFRLGVLLEKSGDLDGASIAMRRAIELDDTQARFHEGLARVLGRGEDMQALIKVLQTAIARHENSAALHFQMGTCFEQQADLDGALMSMRTACAIDASVPAFHIGIARVLVKRDQRSDAIGVLETASEKIPNNAQIHFQLGRVLETSGDLGRAASAMEKAVALKPDVERFHIGLAKVHKRLENKRMKRASD